MHKWLIVMIVSAWLLTACNTPSSQEINKTEQITQVIPEKIAPTITDTPTPIKTAIPIQNSSTPVPTNTRIPTYTATVTLTEQPVIFRDDFDQELKEGWRWIRGNPQNWSLTQVPGFLSIILQQGFFSTRDLENMLTREIPSGVFQISTLVRFRPAGNFQSAGLYIYQDAANFVFVGRGFCNNRPGCLGNGLYFQTSQDGNMDPKNFATKVANNSLVYLMMKREKNIYTAFFSEDGKVWKLFGKHTNNMNPSLTGIAAGQAVDPGYAAEFDFFTLERILE
jgi:beta-xylosidase